MMLSKLSKYLSRIKQCSKNTEIIVFSGYTSCLEDKMGKIPIFLISREEDKKWRKN